MRWPWSRQPLTRGELGALGERHAARFLRAAGLRILEGNYRTRHGELDIIARDGDTLVFVEVRTRTSDFITPLDSVDTRKQEKIVHLAHQYLLARRVPPCPCRYDVVEVMATHHGNITSVQHFPGAFIEGM